MAAPLLRQRSAPVTSFLILVNTAVYIFITIFVGDAGTLPFLDEYGLHPREFWEHQKVWQPLTSMFIHVFLIHYAFNMLALWSVGTPLEMTIGSVGFAWLYMISGFAGSLFLLIFNPDLGGGAHGASGAVFGLLGALAIFYPNSRLLVMFIPMKAITAAFVLAGLSLFMYLFDVLTIIAHMAHLGGLVGGFLYSKFALQLEIGRSTLSAAPGVAWWDERKRKATPEEEVLRMMRGLADEEAQPKPKSPYSDARSDALSQTRRDASAPDTNAPAPEVKDVRYDAPPSMPSVPPVSEGPRDVAPPQDSPGSAPEPGSGEKRLHFNPETGKFELR